MRKRGRATFLVCSTAYFHHIFTLTLTVAEKNRSSRKTLCALSASSSMISQPIRVELPGNGGTVIKVLILLALAPPSLGRNQFIEQGFRQTSGIVPPSGVKEESLKREKIYE